MKKIVEILNKIQMFTYDVLEVISAIVLSVTIVVVTLGIVSRYVFNNSLSWTEEVCCIMLVWLAYFTAGLATVSKSHVVADFLSQKLTGTAKVVQSWIVRIMEVFFLVTITYALIKLYPSVRLITPALEISRKIYYIPMIFMSIYMILVILLDFLNDLYPGYNCWAERQKLRDKENEAEEDRRRAESLASVDHFMDELEEKSNE
jgi:TRAP-type C4-dicarboxylate transport system permease small subunit